MTIVVSTAIPCFHGQWPHRTMALVFVTKRSPRLAQACDTHGQVTRQFFAKMYRKNAASLSRDAQFVRACAVETHMHKSQKAISCEYLQVKCWGASSRHRLCASLRSQNACHNSYFCEHLQEKCRPQSRDAHGQVTSNLQERCRAPRSRGKLCASLRHGAQEPFYVRIYRENAGGQTEHPYLTSAFYLP